jgi:hypothetical protein
MPSPFETRSFGALLRVRVEVQLKNLMLRSLRRKRLEARGFDNQNSSQTLTFISWRLASASFDRFCQ